LDKKLRSLIKSATYRIIAFIILLTITWYATGDFVQTTFHFSYVPHNPNIPVIHP